MSEFASKTTLVIDTNQMNLTEYLNCMYSIYGRGWIKIFEDQLFRVSQVSEDLQIFGIKYEERCDLWTCWAREARGAFFLFDEDINKFVCIKMLLQRGAEVLTNAWEDITETENIGKDKGIGHLNVSQQETITLLKERSPNVEFTATFKVDGSLCGISLFNLESNIGQTILKMVTSSTDPKFDIQKVLINKTRDMGFFPILNTSGTFFIGDNMLAYMVTAICVGACSVSQDDIELWAKTQTPLQVFENNCGEFIEKLGVFYRKTCYRSDRESSMCASFEAVCKNRTTAWEEHHKELAISYKFAMFRFLGCTFNVGRQSGYFLPHFVLRDEITHLFEHPLFWNVKGAVTMELMLIDLERVIKSEMYEDEYLLAHVPENYSDTRKVFDFEGFVIYRKVGSSSSTQTYDYNKVKTRPYYLAHKYKTENIEYLVSLGRKAREVFPLCYTVYHFFDTLNVSLLKVSDTMHNILKSQTETSELFLGLPAKARINFFSRPFETRAKMLINGSITWNKICFSVFQDIYSAFKFEFSENCAKVFKSLLMEIKPWSEESGFEIDSITRKFNPSVKDFFSLCNESTQ